MANFGLKKLSSVDKDYQFFELYKGAYIKYKIWEGPRRDPDKGGDIDNYEAFWRVWLSFKTNKLLERVGDYFPFMIDLDMEFMDKKDVPGEEDIIQFYQIVSMHLKRKFKNFIGDDEIICVVQSRKSLKKKHNNIKRGLHLLFPGIIINNEMAKELRESILNEPCGNIFRHCVNSKNDIFDKQIYESNRAWKMNGHDYDIWMILGKNGELNETQIIEVLKRDLQSTYDGIFANDDIGKNYKYYLPLLTTMNRARYISLAM
jgi:hypothetical protein